MSHLVIVESPAKAKTIKRFLGKEYLVEASMGHIRDLPSSTLAVDVEGDFTPEYEVPEEKAKVVRMLRAKLKEAKDLWIATDEDREGEAIGWHLTQVLNVKDPSTIKRIVFHEITETAIKEAIEHPRTLDMKLVDAQQARRVLDRLVGYTLSPFLWKKVYRGLSAGRVQSVAVRIIVDREREIRAFVPVEYWTLDASMETEKKNNSWHCFRRKRREVRPLLQGRGRSDACRSQRCQLEGDGYRGKGTQEDSPTPVYDLDPATGGRPQTRIFRQTDDGRCPTTVRRCQSGKRRGGTWVSSPTCVRTA